MEHGDKGHKRGGVSIHTSMEISLHVECRNEGCLVENENH